MLKNVRYITVARAIVPCMSLEMAGKNFKISQNCLIIAWEQIGAIFQQFIMDVYGCKEQEMTSSEVGFRVLGFVWLSLGEIGQIGRGLYFVCVLDKINVAIVNNFCFNGMQCN